MSAPYLFIFWCGVHGIFCANIDVSTRVGTIRGVASSITIDGASYTYKKYLGIPFAKPPVGDRRWRKPEEYGSLGADVFDASSYGNICPQIRLPGLDVVGTESEDCLYLNIWVPDASPAPDVRYSVMIFIYGGGFILGAANMYDGAELSNFGNVILVTLNYRVGPMGFLSTGDAACPGNFGFWDQIMAIKWVKNNIEFFGGDPDRMTVFGESAGAISSALLAMFPGEGKLFQRAISESGVGSVSFIDYKRDTSLMVKAIADKFGCYRSQNAETIKCLKNIAWKELMTKVNELNENVTKIEYINFDPVLDNDFIKVDPKDVLKHYSERNMAEVEFFRSHDFVNGFNMYEGGVSMQYFAGGDMNAFMPTTEEFKSLITYATTMLHPGELSPAALSMVAHAYTNWTDPENPELIRLQYAAIHGDLQFGFPAVLTSRLHADGGSVSTGRTYFFHFRPAPSRRFETTPAWLDGADHGDEEQFVFGLLTKPYFQPWERELSRTMMQYWTAFARTG